MNKHNCRYHQNEFPIEGEIVIGKIAKVTELGVFIEITEYDNLEGLIVVGELTRKRINNAQRAVKNGKMEVAMVSRVDKVKRYVDLSRIKVTPEEKERCLEQHYRNKTAHSAMVALAQRIGIELFDLYSQFGWDKFKSYGNLYNYFVAVLEDPKVAENEKFSEEIIEAVQSKFKNAKIKVYAEVSVSFIRSGAVHYIKSSLRAASENDPEVEVAMIKPPLYSISKMVDKPEDGIGVVKTICCLIQARVVNMGGKFVLAKEPVIYGDKKLHKRGLEEIEEVI